MSSVRLLTRAARNVCWTFAQRGRHLGRPSGLLLHADSSREYIKFAPIVTTRHSISTKKSPENSGKADTKLPTDLVDDQIFGSNSKLGLFARFKLMYKKYWYVLIPVHVVTSLSWFGGFYYMSQSGVDIPALLAHFHVSEYVIERFHNSSMGHFAIAYLCFKIATPLRYAVTLGGTTVFIKYLVLAGHIKPMPTKAELIELCKQKKADRAAKQEEKEKKSKESQDK